MKQNRRDVIEMTIVLGVFLGACLIVIIKPGVYTAIFFFISIPSSIILCEVFDRQKKPEVDNK